MLTRIREIRMAQIRNVLVVGSGTMGSQIALQTAFSGHYDVTLVDSKPEQLERAVEQNQKLVARGVEKGRLTQEQGTAALGRLRTSTDLAGSAALADLAIEAIYENLDAKREVFQALDQNAPPGTVLASNSSTIAISRLAEVTERPEDCCNTHFFHPVTVMQLCEVVRGPKTSDRTVEVAMEFVRSIDRVPVLINKEVHGFVVNRILFAAAEEAMRLYEGGYASAEDIDTAVKKGLNWPMGPFELLDFSGLDIFYGALEDRARLEGGPGAPAILKEKIDQGHLGRKTGKGFFDYAGRA
jgi:3-hydroxybutyryl-CoA dehydrogenase